MSSWLLLYSKVRNWAYFSVLVTERGEKVTFAAIAIAHYGRHHLQTDQLFNLSFVYGKVCMQMQSHLY